MNTLAADERMLPSPVRRAQSS